MDDARINRLSKRHSDVLRGVAALKKTKQIAADLGIAPGTVDGYIAEAVRILAAADRGDAARIFLRHASGAVDAAGSASAAPDDPGKSGGQSPWMGSTPDPLPPVDQPARSSEADTVIAPLPPQRRPFALPLPWRRPGQRDNDLSVLARLFWVPAIAVVLAVGFGMLASGLKVLADLIERLSHL